MAAASRAIRIVPQNWLPGRCSTCGCLQGAGQPNGTVTRRSSVERGPLIGEASPDEGIQRSVRLRVRVGPWGAAAASRRVSVHLVSALTVTHTSALTNLQAAPARSRTVLKWIPFSTIRAGDPQPGLAVVEPVFRSCEQHGLAFRTSGGAAAATPRVAHQNSSVSRPRARLISSAIAGRCFARLKSRHCDDLSPEGGNSNVNLTS